MEAVNTVRLRISCITLPVAGLQRSFGFYRDVPGLAARGSAPGAGQVAFELGGGIYRVLILCKEFGTSTEMTGHTEAAAVLPNASWLLRAGKKFTLY